MEREKNKTNAIPNIKGVIALVMSLTFFFRRQPPSTARDLSEKDDEVNNTARVIFWLNSVAIMTKYPVRSYKKYALYSKINDYD